MPLRLPATSQYVHPHGILEHKLLPYVLVYHPVLRGQHCLIDIFIRSQLPMRSCQNDRHAHLLPSPRGLGPSLSSGRPNTSLLNAEILSLIGMISRATPCPPVARHGLSCCHRHAGTFLLMLALSLHDSSHRISPQPPSSLASTPQP